MNRLWVFFLLFSIPVLGQKSGIKGTVTAAGEPLELVNIIVENLERGTMTAGDGSYLLENIPQGTYRISARSLGFISQGKEVSIKAGQLLTINFDLIQDRNELAEILIIDKRAGLNKKTPYNISTIEMQGLQTTGSAGGLMATLREVPGVYGAELGQGIVKPFIRGVGFTRIVTIYQGNKLENHQWGADHGLGVNDLGIGNVDIIKGPASVLYGSGALGGVLLVNDRESYLNSNSITGNAGSTFNSISNGYRFKASAGKKFSNDLFFATDLAYENHADYKDGDNRIIGNSRFNVVTFRLHTGIDRERFKNKLSFSYNSQNLGIITDEEMQPGESLATHDWDREMQLPFQKVKDLLLSYNQKTFHNNFETTLHVSHHSNKREEIESSFYQTDLGLKQDHSFYNARIKFPKGKISHSLGVQGSYLTNRNLPEAEDILIPDANLFETGLYYLAGVDLDSWFFQGALRYDYREVTAIASAPNLVAKDFILPGNPENRKLTRIFSGTTASLGATKMLNSNNTVKLNISGGFRAPDLAELFSNGPHPGTSRFEKGNDQFEREQSLQADVSYAYNNQRFRMNISGYGSVIDNYIFFEAAGEQHENGMELWEYRQTTARFTGLEFEMKHSWLWNNQLETGLNATMVRAMEKNTGNPLAFIPPDNLNATIDYYALEDKSLHFNSRLRLVNRQNRTGMNEESTPGYVLLNFGVNKSWFINRTTIEGGVTLQNALNKTYTDHMSILRAFNVPSTGRNLMVNLRYSF
ncbi:MAG TPA: TonB-dependent receptor [Gillisia sp.]|nr:TonB-dependent receptor [Gillisia sp.]